MSTSLTVLENPAAVPAEALDRLLALSMLLSQASAGQYTSLLSRLATITLTARSCLERAIQGENTPADLVAIANAGRVAKAAGALLEELAKRSVEKAQILNMSWARAARRVQADLLLVLREYIPLSRRLASLDSVQAEIPVRILPGAEDAIKALESDPLAFASDWDLQWLADRLSAYVR